MKVYLAEELWLTLQDGWTPWDIVQIFSILRKSLLVVPHCQPIRFSLSNVELESSYLMHKKTLLTQYIHPQLISNGCIKGKRSSIIVATQYYFLTYYAASNWDDNTIRYLSSEMLLRIDSDAAYLVCPQVRSRAEGCHFLGYNYAFVLLVFELGGWRCRVVHEWSHMTMAVRELLLGIGVPTHETPKRLTTELFQS